MDIRPTDTDTVRPITACDGQQTHSLTCPGNVHHVGKCWAMPNISGSPPLLLLPITPKSRTTPLRMPLLEVSVKRQSAARPDTARKAGRATESGATKRRGAKWLCCASGKGGNGKTTTSLNLAVFAVHAGLKVCLVDLDSQRTLSRWHDRRPEAAPDLMLWSGRLTDVRKAIADIGEQMDLDLVIVDTPPGIDDHPTEVAQLLAKADFVLVPTTQGTADLDSVVEFMSFLKREHVRDAFLMNRAQRTIATYRKAKNRLIKAGPLCPTDIRQLEDVQATHDLGAGVLEFPRSRAIEDYQGLWDFVCSQMEIA